MTTHANEKLQGSSSRERISYLKRIKQEIYARIIEYECIIKYLREDLDTINSMHFSSTFFDRSIPNYKAKFNSMLRDKIWDLEQYLDEENKRFHDLEEEIAEDEKDLTSK